MDGSTLREINPDKYEYISAAPGPLPDDGGQPGDVLVMHDMRGEDKDIPFLWVAAQINRVDEPCNGSPRAVWTARVSSFDPTTHEKCRWMRKKPLWKQLGNFCPCAFDGSKDHLGYCILGPGAKEVGIPK